MVTDDAQNSFLSHRWGLLRHGKNGRKLGLIPSFLLSAHTQRWGIMGTAGKYWNVCNTVINYSLYGGKDGSERVLVTSRGKEFLSPDCLHLAKIGSISNHFLVSRLRWALCLSALLSSLWWLIGTTNSASCFICLTLLPTEVFTSYRGGHLPIKRTFQLQRPLGEQSGLLRQFRSPRAFWHYPMPSSFGSFLFSLLRRP